MIMKSNHAPFGSSVEEIVKRDIANESDWVLEIAVTNGQIFENVKHTDMFFRLCMEEYNK